MASGARVPETVEARLGFPDAFDRRVRIGIRQQVDRMKELRQIAVAQLAGPRVLDPARLAARIDSFDVRIAMLIAAARPRPRIEPEPQQDMGPTSGWPD